MKEGIGLAKRMRCVSVNRWDISPLSSGEKSSGIQPDHCEPQPDAAINICLDFVCMHKAAAATAILSDIGQFTALRQRPLYCMTIDQSRTSKRCSTYSSKGRG